MAYTGVARPYQKLAMQGRPPKEPSPVLLRLSMRFLALLALGKAQRR
jgi:hypothetical protein